MQYVWITRQVWVRLGVDPPSPVPPRRWGARHITAAAPPPPYYPFPRGKSILEGLYRVLQWADMKSILEGLYRVLQWADMNAATPLAWGRSGISLKGVNTMQYVWRATILM